MSIRTDIIVDWNVSPRIVTVLEGGAQDTEITIQDLTDTLRSIEASPEAMNYEYLIDATGKEELGGGVLVGITLQMNNAILGFEDRSGPTFEQCNISGGNLTAIDNIGDSLEPVQTTAYTQIVRTSSSSATLQDLDAIQYASYGGGISVDITSENLGTDYPNGNQEYPVNNIPDAAIIALTKGFKRLFIIGNITLTTGDNIAGYTLIGENPVQSTITIETGADITNCEIVHCTLQGILDGGNTIRKCEISNINYVNGEIEYSTLTGTIILGGSKEAHLYSCRSGVAGSGTPIIDCGGSGQGLQIRDYNGGVKVINKDGTDKISIDMNSGQIKFGVDVTNGEIVCRGVGKITEDLSNGATIINQMLNPTTILEEDVSSYNGNSAGSMLNDVSYTDKWIYVDSEELINGDGKSSSPFNNFPDAVDYAESVGWKRIYIRTDITLDRTLKNFTIEGIGLPTVDFNGQNVDKSEFSKVKITGLQVGSITSREVVLLSNLTGMNGVYKEVALAGDLSLANNCFVTIAQVSSLIPGLGSPSIDFVLGYINQSLNIRKLSGGMLIKNMDDATNIATIEYVAGKCNLDNSNTAGLISIRGIPESALTDNSNGTTVEKLSMLTSPDEQIIIRKMLENKVIKNGDIITIYEDNDTTVWKQFDLSNGGRVEV